MPAEQPKEALTQIETGNKPSIYTLKDFFSTFPKHQQDRYNVYRRVLELHQEGELSKRAIAKELNYPQTTVNTWINEKYLPPIERKIRELKDLGLYPLTSDNQHLPFIALLAGWNMGDGHLKRNLRELNFFDGEKTSLENLKTYIQAHFPKLSTSNIKKEPLRNEYSLTVSNTALSHFFATIGVPVGNEVEVPFSVPQFVLNGSDEVKRYYLAGLIASEMDTPKNC